MTLQTVAGGPTTLGRVATFAMAAAAAVAVANIYYNQPMLAVIERDLPGSLTSAIPTATQFGYALGLFLIVPLGDLVERRRLIVGQFIVLALALVLAATASNAAMIVLASLAVGLASTVAQQIVPFAAHLAAPARRGTTVGIVMAGLLTGILLSRTVAGIVATYWGWRDMFWLGVPMALGMAGLMAATLPRSEADLSVGYGGLLRSIADLWIEFPALRLAAMTQSALFAAFGIFWTILAFRLGAPQFGFGADIVGLFGLIGMVGILAAPVAGRIADKRGAAQAVMFGAGATLFSWIIFSGWTSLAGLVTGVVVLDFGAQSSLVSNQHIVFALRPEARARLNTILMGAMFLGGAVGSGLATLAWTSGGWPLVCGLGLGFSGLATALQIRGRPRRRGLR